jgi:hypothetical protein
MRVRHRNEAGEKEVSFDCGAAFPDPDRPLLTELPTPQILPHRWVRGSRAIEGAEQWPVMGAHIHV